MKTPSSYWLQASRQSKKNCFISTEEKVAAHIGRNMMSKRTGIDEAGHVNLKIRDQDGRLLFFKIKRDSEMEKLMTKYCSEKGVKKNSFVFLFDGKQLPPNKTPEQLNLKDQDEIDAMTHQVGGTSSMS